MADNLSKNILITGSNGFIGKNIIYKLKELGFYYSNVGYSPKDE